MDIKRLITNYNKKALVPIIILAFLLLYPNKIQIGDIVLVDIYTKKRLISVGILFLILRGFVHDYYLSSWGILFLLALVAASTLPFGMIVFLTIASFIVLKTLRKI